MNWPLWIEWPGFCYSFRLKLPVFDHFWSTKKRVTVYGSIQYWGFPEVALMLSSSLGCLIRKQPSFSKADFFGTTLGLSPKCCLLLKKCLLNKCLRKSDSKAQAVHNQTELFLPLMVNHSTNFSFNNTQMSLLAPWGL